MEEVLSKGPGILKTKKRGSSSEAKKERKKLKRRLKRAEANRKLNVKRLKFTPVFKPKVVQHCRHYAKGRCHEGEKCKFSHDVIPLTKSKPCSHLARQACMKGEDCPFDHQLSKYPCNNYVDTGFCGRGDSCMFSHKIPANQVSNGDTGGFNVQPRMGVGIVSHLRNMELDDPSLSTSQGVDCASLDRTSVDNPGDSKQESLPAHWQINSGYVSSGKSLQNDSANHLINNTSGRSGKAVEIRTQLNLGMSSRGLSLLQTYKGTSTPAITKGITVCSSGGPSVDKVRGESAGPFTINGEANSQTSFREKASASEKSKDIQPELQGSQSSSGQFTTKFDLPVKNITSNAQRALQSALDFAAEHESTIKMSSVADSKR